MFQDIAKQAEKFVSSFDALTNAISWGIDKRIRMSIASQFMISGKELEPKEFLNVSDFLKKDIKWYSGINQEMRYTLASLLINQFPDPIQAFSDLKECYNALTKKGFHKGPYTYLAAYTLLSHPMEGMDRSDQAGLAMELYKAMKSKHFFLTSNDDYPLAVLLSNINYSIEHQMENIEFFYHYLGDRVFRKGNDLQFLSHILTYGENSNRERLAENCVNLYEQFRKHNLKIKGIHFSTIGVLALLDEPEKYIYEIISIDSILNEKKLFRWYKEMSSLFSIQMLVKDKIQDKDLLSIGTATNIQAIILAQQAASIAAISAATAAASSSTSN